MRSMFQNYTGSPSRVSALSCVFIALFSVATASYSQTPTSTMGQPGTANASDQNKQLADQITELQGQVAKLQAAVQQDGHSKKGSPKPGMKMTPPNKGMGMMEEKGEMSGMAPGGKDKASPMPAAAMGMCCMGKGASGGKDKMSSMPADTGGAATMNGSSSAMPGQAGTSHLYHIGSNGFFLNHSRHITLTPDQTLTLNHLKEKATLDSTYEQRRIDQGERELYTLTGADQPDNAGIQAKIVEIEKLRADQRMNFIRAVADATNVLTSQQRQALLGTMAAAKN